MLEMFVSVLHTKLVDGLFTHPVRRQVLTEAGMERSAMTDSTERFRHCALLPPENYSRAAFVGKNLERVDGLFTHPSTSPRLLFNELIFVTKVTGTIFLAVSRRNQRQNYV